MTPKISSPAATVTIDATELAQLRTDAAEANALRTENAQLRAAAEDGRIARAEQTKTRHEGIVTNAIRAGKFGPARRDAWLNRLRIDEDDALADLNSIPDGLIPLTAIGDAGTTDEDSADRRAYGRVYGN